MSPRAPVRNPLAVAVALALAWPGFGRGEEGDTFHPGTWRGSVELGITHDKESFNSNNQMQSVDLSRNRFRERVSVENDNFYLIDPGLATGVLGVTYDLIQTRETSDGISDSIRERLVGYNFDSTFLSALPYNGRVFANRSQNQIVLPFGRSDLKLQNEGVHFRLQEDSPLRDHGFPFFSADLKLERQHSEETTHSVLGQDFTTNQTQNNLQFDARKGFLNSDLDFSFQRLDLDDPQFPRSSFRSDSETLKYNLDFGADLNRRWDMRFYRYDRSGATPIRVTDTDDMLRIDHFKNLSTQYRLLTTSIESQGGTAKTEEGTFIVHYEPYKKLLLDNSDVVVHQTLPAGTRDSYWNQTGAAYSHDVLDDATLHMHLGGRYQIDDNKLTSSSVQVIDETQAAPPALGAGAGFLLGQPFVSAGSIVVVDARGGARFPTTPGLDYVLQIEGNRTRIVPLPTSAVIQANDPLLITYTYELDPSVKYRTLTGSAGIGLSFPWMNVSYEHDQSDQHLLSGFAGQFLDNTRKDTLLFGLHRDWDVSKARADSSYIRYESTLLSYRQIQYGGLLGYKPSTGADVALTADQTRTDFTTAPAHQTVSSSARLTYEWVRPGYWPLVTSSAALGRRVYRDTLQATETINEASWRTRATYGKLDLISVLTASSRTIDGSKTNNFSVELTAIRRF